ncbi:protein EcsC [Aquicoccus sp. SCR17]|nr:protein EcsC [Carideicomes alvinocaridis]
MTEILPSAPTAPLDTEAVLDALARRHRAAGGLGLQVLNLVGGQAENLLDRLPDRVKDRLDSATEQALRVAIRAAGQSRGVVRDQAGWLNTAVTTAMGGMGGVGGLPTALAELPVTTTVLLRAIMGIAAEYGFDPAEEEVQKHCLHVFSAAGPLAEDDGSDMAFLAARVTLTGSTLRGIIGRVAPRLGTVLGQKLAAQTVPLLGAVAGAATNYAYTSYYQEMAHVHFGLLRLSRETGLPPEHLAGQLRQRLKRDGA